MQSRWVLSLAVSALTFSALAAPVVDWPQFRGPGGNAVSETAMPPVDFGPETNLLWKTTLPLGYSSPVVAGERIFVTSDEQGLETMALNRKDGRIVWRQAARPGEKRSTKKPAGKDLIDSLTGLPPLEEKEPAENPGGGGRAAATPVVDDGLVYAFFGTVGLIAYDLEGKEQWRQPLAKPDNQISASPIIIGNHIFIVCDVGPGSFVQAFDKKTGRSMWRKERERMHRSDATPFHWVSEKRDELVVSGSYWLTSYDPQTGEQNWQYSGTAKTTSSTPVALRGLLITASGRAGSDPGDPVAAPGDPLDLLAPVGQVVKAPLPDAENALLAVRSCGKGEVNQSHLAWKKMRSLPEAASPVIYQGRLFTVKSGGLVSAYNLDDGKAIFQDERLNALGDYYASPVAAAGRVYFVAQTGMVSVIDAKADTLTVLAQNKLGEPILATPALVGGQIIVRTEKSLYAFGAADANAD